MQQTELEQHLHRIGPAARSDRATARFPYSPRDGHPEDVEAIRQELDEFFRANLPLIKGVVKSRVSYVSQHDRDDWVAEIVVHLITRSIPLYEPSRGAKLTSFVRTCANNHLTGLIRKAMTRKEQCLTGIDIHHGVVAPDSSADRAIEQLADSVIADPSAFLSRSQARVVAAVIEHPDDYRHTTAKRLGYRSAAAISETLHRARQKLVELVEEVA